MTSADLVLTEEEAAFILRRRERRLALWFAKVEPTSFFGCWTWTAHTNDGYGQFHDGTRDVGAHRWAYEWVHGPVLIGLELDHLCRNRACVNPLHLDPVTLRENQMRGAGFVAANAAKAHCPQGHPYDEANTYRHGSRRQCLTCRRERDASRSKKTAARGLQPRTAA